MADAVDARVSSCSETAAKKRKTEQNRGYYEQKKDTIKQTKVRFDFKIQVAKENEGRLESIKRKIEKAKTSLHLHTQTTSTGNADLMETLLDHFFKSNNNTSTVSSSSFHDPAPVQNTAVPTPPTHDLQIDPSFQPNKKQLHSECHENDELYLVCGSAISRLFRYFTQENSCCCDCGKELDFTTFSLNRITPHNHCAKTVVKCQGGHSLKWFSSSVMSSPSSGKYYANIR